MAERTLNYTPPGPVVQRFQNSPAFVRGIKGPIGSGKSAGCTVEILKRSMLQAPSPLDGIRHTRWAVIRNSYPELKTTTIKTYFEWCPQEYGKANYDSPITHKVRTNELDIEVLFMALDREEDARKLLSLELTGAWINEAREVPKAIVDALTGRVGRYPSKMNGGCSWSGILMDTNAPDDQSWWYHFAEEDVPEGWEFFSQPSGDSPEAENLQNLPQGYYQRIKAGKDPDWIKVYVHGEYGFVTEGKPVFPMFRDSVHVSPLPIQPIEGFPLLLGADFGLTPAAVIGQKLPDGRWLIIDEVVSDDCGNVRFSEKLTKYMAQYYPTFEIDTGWGDPAGLGRAQSDERTAIEIMNTHTPWTWRAAPSNDPLMRREVVIGALNRMVDGNPGILVSPKAKFIRKGFSGGYHFKFVRSGNGAQIHEAPAKNEFSHPHDALQYLLLGGGEHTIVLKGLGKKKGRASGMAKGLNYDVFSSVDE